MIKYQKYTRISKLVFASVVKGIEGNAEEEEHYNERQSNKKGKEKMNR